MTIEFFVPGKPQPRGSKRGFGFKRANGSIGVAMADDNKRSGPWMERVALVAAEAYDGEPIEGPVELSIAFRFARPKSHYGTGRNSQKLKPSAPTHHTQKPDLTKLVRPIEDAMTGIVWRDDKLVGLYDRVTKSWTEGREGALVTVREVGAGTPPTEGQP